MTADELKVLNEAQEHFMWAEREHGPYASSHEGFAIMAEEVDELWDEVKSKPHTEGRDGRIYREALQVAAAAMRVAVGSLNHREGW